MILFTDDTTVFNSHQSKKYLEFMLSQDLEMLIDWFKANQLLINLDKTMMMYFWPTGENINMKTGSCEIPCISFTKFLGVFLDNAMSWRYHAEHLHNKLAMNKHLLTTSKNKLDHDSLQKVYFSHIHSHLTYGIKAWGPSLCVRNLNNLFKQL